MTDPDAAPRFVCIHGHFYQPPRENPWLEAVEVQDSAAPYHDWNQRVCAEAYAPNAAARLVDGDGFITAVSNNYDRMSFNFGPTLLAWIEHAEPELYARIRAADANSAGRLGRGNALAQVYAHCIMPLASPRDQQTQVRWGIADFRHRFGRLPDGMWLPETAVDLASLEVLAENGIRFTILAPSQALQVRGGDGPWQDVSDGSVDTGRAYRCVLPSGRDIILFFYDGAVSHEIAFGGLLNDGRALAYRLSSQAVRRTDSPLIHVATDGESYGHHHRFGEMAVAAALEALDGDPRVYLTNYAAYLDRVPVRYEVAIKENTAWSCVHGLERWRSNCGCNAGQPGWSQEWRTPVREAVDWLKEQLDACFEQHGRLVLRDPWHARDAYVTVLLDGAVESRARFLAAQASREPTPEVRHRIWTLLEMQRHAMLTFTSCGWFFDEPSGIETVQILTYAARAIQLAADFGVDLEPGFVRRLAPIRSNLPDRFRDGSEIYDRLVRPAIADGRRLVAHYAMNSLFLNSPADAHTYAQRIVSIDRGFESAGTARLAVGRVRLEWRRTEEAHEYTYAALHLGSHDIHCAVSEASDTYLETKAALIEGFRTESLAEVVRRIDRAMGGMFYTLNDVFAEERRRILEHVTAGVSAACTAEYEGIVSQNRRLLDFLSRVRVPVPQELRLATAFVLQRHLEQAVERFVGGQAPADDAIAVQGDARRWDIPILTDRARAALERGLEAAVRNLDADGADAALRSGNAILDLADALGLTLNLWTAQNRFYQLLGGNGNGTRGLLAAPGRAIRAFGTRLRFQLREWQTAAGDVA